MRTLTFTIDERFEGKQAAALLRHIGCSGKMLAYLKKDDRLKINGAPARTVNFLRSGDVLTLELEDGQAPLPNERLNVPVLFENDDFAAFDKPAFMPVHEALNHFDDTLANFFAARYPGLTFRAVNRLDRNTSGICIVAKNRLSASKLSKKAALEKTYFAVCGGKIETDGVVEAPVGRTGPDEMLREVRADGQYALTRYKVLKSCETASLLEIHIETGRTHQIRVHLAHIMHPLLGDELYGGDRALISRHALHCGEMIVRLDGKTFRIGVPLPEDMNTLCERLFG